MKRVFFILALITLSVAATAQSVFQVTGQGFNRANPEQAAVSPWNAYVGAEVTREFSGPGFEEDFLYNGLFLLNLVKTKNQRGAVALVSKFNPNDFNLEDFFDQGGVSAGISPYYLLSNTESPWVVYGSLKGRFDVTTPSLTIGEGSIGLEKNISNLYRGATGSIGASIMYSTEFSGIGIEAIGVFPMGPTTGITGRYAYYNGDGQFSIGLVTAVSTSVLR